MFYTYQQFSIARQVSLYAKICFEKLPKVSSAFNIDVRVGVYTC